MTIFVEMYTQQIGAAQSTHGSAINTRKRNQHTAKQPKPSAAMKHVKQRIAQGVRRIRELVPHSRVQLYTAALTCRRNITCM